MNGYASEAYARSLAEFGTPRPLPASEGWLLERAIPGNDGRDAIGAYPVFACRNWSALGADLDALDPSLVSVTLVTDPFAGIETAELTRVFPDLARPYKDHFVTDLASESLPDAHHRRNAERALERLTVDATESPGPWLDEWCGLYDHLVARHSIGGIARFSRESFRLQMAVPGIVAIRALLDHVTAGMTLWFMNGDVAYYHLGAYSEAGYDARASFALFARAREYFRGRVRWLALGAGAGVDGDAGDGLTRFKRGWSTGTRPVFLCGRIINRSAYTRLTAHRSGAAFFPAYRAPRDG